MKIINNEFNYQLIAESEDDMKELQSFANEDSNLIIQLIKEFFWKVFPSFKPIQYPLIKEIIISKETDVIGIRPHTLDNKSSNEIAIGIETKLIASLPDEHSNLMVGNSKFKRLGDK